MYGWLICKQLVFSQLDFFFFAMEGHMTFWLAFWLVEETIYRRRTWSSTNSIVCLLGHCILDLLKNTLGIFFLFSTELLHVQRYKGKKRKQNLLDSTTWSFNAVLYKICPCHVTVLKSASQQQNNNNSNKIWISLIYLLFWKLQKTFVYCFWNMKQYYFFSKSVYLKEGETPSFRVFSWNISTAQCTLT